MDDLVVQLYCCFPYFLSRSGPFIGVTVYILSTNTSAFVRLSIIVIVVVIFFISFVSLNKFYFSTRWLVWHSQNRLGPFY